MGFSFRPPGKYESITRRLHCPSSEFIHFGSVFLVLQSPHVGDEGDSNEIQNWFLSCSERSWQRKVTSPSGSNVRITTATVWWVFPFRCKFWAYSAPHNIHMFPSFSPSSLSSSESVAFELSTHPQLDVLWFPQKKKKSLQSISVLSPFLFLINGNINLLRSLASSPGDDHAHFSFS